MAGPAGPLVRLGNRPTPVNGCPQRIGLRDELRDNHWGVEARGRIPRRNDDDAHGASLIRVQLRLGCPGVAKPASQRVTAALRSTVLGPAIEFTFSAGDVVTARCASIPGPVGLVLMAVRGALVVDGPHGLLDRTASLSPRPTDSDSRGNDDRPGGRQERPEDRRGHEGQPVTQTTKQFMRQLLYSSPCAGHHVGRPMPRSLVRTVGRRTTKPTSYGST